MPTSRISIPLTLVIFVLAGCTPNGGTSDTGVCASGDYWSGGNEESPLMNPGESCITCHSRGEGPSFDAAGTVMGGYTEPDDCNGTPSVIVRLTDADSVVHETTTNAAGNFYFEERIAMPYTAELESDLGINFMSASQSTGDCASCHTAEGAEGAPGRIVAPG